MEFCYIIKISLNNRIALLDVMEFHGIAGIPLPDIT